jgi:hypothetical protein
MLSNLQEKIDKMNKEVKYLGKKAEVLKLKIVKLKF